ncbi:MAG TPA: hypothetical protein ENN84_04095 [Candidatus Marinimicrobia bacterium]|nr:hypothetical protein [Candidatus Neomarinimicrobiota bacterium]
MQAEALAESYPDSAKLLLREFFKRNSGRDEQLQALTMQAAIFLKQGEIDSAAHLLSEAEN